MNANGHTQAVVFEELRAQMQHALLTQTEMLERITGLVSNHVLTCELITIPAEGFVSRQWHLPCGSVAITPATITGALTLVSGSATSNTPPGNGTAMGRVVAPSAAGAARSNYAAATNATAGQTLATLTGLAPGTYDIQTYAGTGGTPGGSDRDNLSLRVNGVEVQRLIVPTTDTDLSTQNIRISVGASTDVVSVVAIANATAGASYFTEIVATPQVRAANTPNAAAVFNIRSHAIAIYGNVGDSFTLQAFTKPQPPV